MISKYQEALDKRRFFNQRAGRELWNDKPRDIQNIDIVNAEKDFDTLQELIDKYDKIKYPKLIPCKCGYNRRHVYYNVENGWRNKVITYECMKCKTKVSTQGSSESKAIRHWNEVMSNE